MATEAPRQFHPAASIFPLMTEAALASLVESIKANGLLDPIKTHDGKIIDGRNRMTACTLAGVTPHFQVAPVGGSPADYVYAVNEKRRHMTDGERALAAARYKKAIADEAKQRMSVGGKKHGNEGVANLPHLEPGRARDIAGKKFGVSGKTVDYASSILRGGTPKLVAAVETDAIAISTAERIASRPKDQQDAEVDRIKGKPTTRKSIQEEPEVEQPEGERRGVGVIRANEAINSLIRIPKNDALRKRGFQIVTDWIKANR